MLGLTAEDLSEVLLPSPTVMPPSIPPAPLRDIEVEEGAKYSEMPASCSSDADEVSHISKKKAIMAVIKSA